MIRRGGRGRAREGRGRAREARGRARVGRVMAVVIVASVRIKCRRACSSERQEEATLHSSNLLQHRKQRR